MNRMNRICYDHLCKYPAKGYTPPLPSRIWKRGPYLVMAPTRGKGGIKNDQATGHPVTKQPAPAPFQETLGEIPGLLLGQ